MVRTGVEPEELPRRQERSIRNDARLLESALAIADDAGWGAMALARVAEHCGLSRMTAKSRFEDRSALGAALWAERLAEPLIDRLDEVVEASPTPAVDADLPRFQRALVPFAEPDREMRAAGELLIVGRYDPAVGDALDTTLQAPLARWLVGGRGSASRARSARRMYAVIIALGLLLQARRMPMPAAQLAGELERLGRALHADRAPTPLPPERLAHLSRPIDFGTGDPSWERLLEATLECVGSLGYDAATIDVITARAGCTRGLLFARYATKQELFLDATERMVAATVNANREFQHDLAERHGLGIADAVLTREFMRPAHRAARTISLEQHRLSWHDPAMLAKVAAGFAEAAASIAMERPRTSQAELRAYIHLSMALGMGLSVVADLHPTVWRLPFDVVIVPSLDAL